MLINMIERADRIAIGGHIRPDGDCVGSTMGFCRYIQDNYKNKIVDVYLEKVPEKFRFLDPFGKIRHEMPADKEYDLFISLDCADKSRLGFSEPLFDTAKHTICVDHHISNHGYAEENYIEAEASSTSELVYKLLDPDRISIEAAEAFYLGIVHDTGVFQYSCASPATFRVAAEILEKGINAPKLIHETYYEKTYAQNQVLGYAFFNSKLYLDGRCIVSYINKDVMEKYGAVRADLDGIVSQLRATKGVEVSVFMDEIGPNTYKVSLRAGDVANVSEIAQRFGGGGHVKAAGLTMEGDPQDIIKILIDQIALQLEK